MIYTTKEQHPKTTNNLFNKIQMHISRGVKMIKILHSIINNSMTAKKDMSHMVQVIILLIRVQIHRLVDFITESENVCIYNTDILYISARHIFRQNGEDFQIIGHQLRQIVINLNNMKNKLIGTIFLFINIKLKKFIRYSIYHICQ